MQLFMQHGAHDCVHARCKMMLCDPLRFKSFSRRCGIYMRLQNPLGGARQLLADFHGGSPYTVKTNEKPAFKILWLSASIESWKCSSLLHRSTA